MTGVPTVMVEPSTFTLVNFDSADIARLVAEAGSWVGLGEGDTIQLNVDESSPLAAGSITSTDPIVISIEGGAFEDPKALRQMSSDAVQTVTVRYLARIADRRRPGFGDAPAEGSLSNAELDCWDAWALGRAARNGLEIGQKRWRYRFRNRHGFTDEADAIFDRLWAADDLTWADITKACAETAAIKPAAE